MELMPGYKRSDIGVIPEEWDIRPLLSTVRIANGQVSPRVEPYKSMVLVAPDHIESSTGKLLAKKTAAEQGAISGKYVFESGDIVYSKIRPYLRKAILADFSGLCSADMYPLKPATDISARYILAVILGYRFSKYAESVSVRSGMPKINRTELADFSLAVPLPPEQRAIAKALSDADELLATLDQVIAKKRDLKQAAMQQLLTGEKRLPGFTGNWGLKSFGDLFDFSGGYSASRDQLSNEGHCYLHYGDIHGSSKTSVNTRRDFLDIPKLSISLGRISEGSLLKHGDVVFVDASEDDAGTSKHLVIENEDDVPFISGLHTIVAKSKANDLAHAYKHYCFQTPAIRQQFMFYAVGTKVSGISKTNIAKLTLPIPSFPEQIAIADVLSSMDAELIALEARRDKTDNIKQAMMQELLTGKTRLVEPRGANA
ncbi:restriction endonuclease subunit S [Aeromonas sobria]|uniref:restriction endonuclease subunit S n=1 Tax=Aeromonas sobria TaxID=646 RepID=UPI00111973FB|nr:restriction endonuclease subunit S [Aeromonas sobria]TNI85861.1 restriction endonuclease subunit S [Aeromonas sobria]